MRTSFVWAGLTFAALAAAAPSRRFDLKVKEAVAPPREWSRVAVAPPDLTIDLRIALPQSNFAALEQHLYEISDPFHERYGAHLSQAEVNELIAPHPESVSQVEDWLAAHGISADSLSRSGAGDWVKVRVPVSVAEEMLDTKYHIWVHENGDALVRTTSYSLPDHLHDHVEFLQPTTLFSRMRGMTSKVRMQKSGHSSSPPKGSSLHVPSAFQGRVDASCATTVTVSCLQQLYNAVGYTPSANSGNRIAVTGYSGFFANNDDLQSFYADQVPSAVNSSFTTVLVNGGQNLQGLADAGGEADLDTQFAFGVAHPIPGTFYSTAGTAPFIADSLTPTDGNEPYLDWVDFVLNDSNPPQTISTSYGDTEQSVPQSYAQRVCQGFATLGARGVSLLFASGDFGVGDGNPDPATQLCFSNDGSNKTQFLPFFPQTCPYVTTVGGTAGIPETAASFSGGAFSNYFSRPSYQNTAVTGYLNKLAPGTYQGLFNPNGRAVPDLSAQSENFRIFFQGQAFSADGTSASAPALAAFVALLNDVRIKAGKSPLGFLNPLIYQLGTMQTSAFNDITSGNNPGCGTPGFNATSGWDPVTGFGTPNFGVLKSLVLSV